MDAGLNEVLAREVWRLAGRFPLHLVVYDLRLRYTIT